jgi:hypothetical protein
MRKWSSTTKFRKVMKINSMFTLIALGFSIRSMYVEGEIDEASYDTKILLLTPSES